MHSSHNETLKAEPVFFVYSVGNFLNNVGEAMLVLVIPLIVFSIDHSSSSMALILTFTQAVSLFSPIFGAMIDKYGPGMLFTLGLILQSCAVMLMIICLYSVSVKSVVFALLAMVNQLGSNLYLRCWRVGLRYVFAEKAPILRAHLNTLFYISRLVGPLLCALFISRVGYMGILYFDLISFLFPFIIQIFNIGHVAMPRKKEHETEKFSLRKNILEGAKVLWNHPNLRALTLSGIFLIFVIDTYTIFFIFWLKAHNHWSDTNISRLGIIMGLGNLAGNLIGKKLVKMQKKYLMLIPNIILFIGFGSCFFTFALMVIGIIVISVGVGMRIAISIMLTTGLTPIKRLGSTGGISALIYSLAGMASSYLVEELGKYSTKIPYLIIMLIAITISILPLCKPEIINTQLQ